MSSVDAVNQRGRRWQRRRKKAVIAKKRGGWDKTPEPKINREHAFKAFAHSSGMRISSRNRPLFTRSIRMVRASVQADADAPMAIASVTICAPCWSALRITCSLTASLARQGSCARSLKSRQEVAHRDVSLRRGFGRCRGIADHRSARTDQARFMSTRPQIAQLSCMTLSLFSQYYKTIRAPWHLTSRIHSLPDDHQS